MWTWPRWLPPFPMAARRLSCSRAGLGMRGVVTPAISAMCTQPVDVADGFCSLNSCVSVLRASTVPTVVSARFLCLKLLPYAHAPQIDVSTHALFARATALCWKLNAQGQRHALHTR